MFLLVGGAVVLTCGCSRENRSTLRADTRDAYRDSVAALDKSWDRAKDYTFDERDKAMAELKSASSRTEARVHDVQANFDEQRADAKQRAAMTELKEADDDYRSKLDALGRAGADTWNAARDETLASWHRLQAAYDRVRSDHDRR
ncbi:MAG TPA: hypothetical protein VHE61_16775 [Opitutaceae bacterium]|nr:hypothetical protein [Opitutaceae bacterium]